LISLHSFHVQLGALFVTVFGKIILHHVKVLVSILVLRCKVLVLVLTKKAWSWSWKIS